MTGNSRHVYRFGILLLGLMMSLLPSRMLLAAPDSPLTERLSGALSDPTQRAFDDQGRIAVWVEFEERTQSGAQLELALDKAQSRLSTQAMERRARYASSGGVLIDARDLPVDESQIGAVSATGAALRRTSRLLNSASFDATPEQITAIAQLSFVREVDLVARYVRTPSSHMGEPVKPVESTGSHKQEGHTLDYGASYDVMSQINVPVLHDLELTGQGVTIAVFDTGFELTHESLVGVDVLAAYDFVDNDDDVGQGKNDPEGSADHGTEVLGLLAGYSAGNLIGPAFGSTVILARTEDISGETIVEEDNWIAALEWAESLGADIISSSVGYYYWYEFEDLDGESARLTVAADLAALRGVSVVTSVGNERYTEGWGHIIAPADGRNVLAVGGVDLSGFLFFTSSPGPTADGRIKPDVMAQAAVLLVPYIAIDEVYIQASGVDLSVPLVAGVVALMREAAPNLTPWQLNEALRETASRAILPDNNYGWGVVDGFAASSYWAPRVEHSGLTLQTAGGTGYPVRATVSGRWPMLEGGVSLAWRVNGGAWQLAGMTEVAEDEYEALIPPRAIPSQIEYYITATNEMGLTQTSPARAPENLHSFAIGSDTEAPQLTHYALSNQALSAWPPTVRVQVSDNVAVDRVELLFSNGGALQGPIELNPTARGYELAFPLDASELQPGSRINYMLQASDTASPRNLTTSEIYSFDVVESRGEILLITNRYEVGSKTQSAPDARGATQVEAAHKVPPSEVMAGWLREIGFAVTVLRSEYVLSSSFLGYDLVFYTTGNNLATLPHSLTEQGILNFVRQGMPLLIEGGDLAYTMLATPAHEDFRREVLYVEDYAGDTGLSVRPAPQHVAHPLLHRPHLLPELITVDVPPGVTDYGAADVVFPLGKATVVMQSMHGTDTGGIMTVDDNTGIDAGQIVYLPFDIGQVAQGNARALLQNAVSYLLMQESAGPSSIAGQVLLAGETEMAGTVVSVGRDRQTLTQSDGSFTLDGLWGGEYSLRIERPGFSSASDVAFVHEGESITGLEYELFPVVQVAESAAPEQSIPDNRPSGIESQILISHEGTLADIEIDIDISHYSIGNLRVSLTSPSGTVVGLMLPTYSLNDNLVGTWPVSLYVDGPGSLDDFLGEPVQGTWTLKVSDNNFGAVGTWHSWGLRIAAIDAPVVDAPSAKGILALDNSPNPFNPRTSIRFGLAQASHVRLSIYDARGRLVRSLLDGHFEAGDHRALWNGKDDRGASLASGAYFARLQADGFEQTNKMILVR